MVYSRVGGGHLSAARALAAELEPAGARPHLLDVYVEAGRFPVTVFPRAYAELARHFPRVWSLIYQTGRLRFEPRRVLRPFMRRGLEGAIALHEPDVVVSVLPAVNGLLAEAAGRAGARFEVVLTDWHSVHRFWVARGVDHYTAPTDSARQDCIRFGAPAARVEVVGIPIRRAFSQPDGDPSAALVRLNLRPGRFTILAMMGAEGSPAARNNIARLMQLQLDAQLIVVCGHNQALQRRIERLPRRVETRVLGFVEGVPELMRAADVLVTKAGGLTLAEAFCTGTPVVVHDVLPGQEAGNLQYALRQRAVLYARDPRRLERAVGDLYADGAMRRDLADCGRRLARPDAAQRIAAGVLARLDC